MHYLSPFFLFEPKLFNRVIGVLLSDVLIEVHSSYSSCFGILAYLALSMKYEIMDRFGSSRYLNYQLDQLLKEVNI